MGDVILGRDPFLLSKFGYEKLLFIGKTQEGDNLYIDSLKPHVIFICGARGSGKSYTMGVIAEELALKNDAVAAVVFDPIGVFWSMKMPNKEERELKLLERWGLKPRGVNNLRVLVPVGVKELPEGSFDGFFAFEASELTAQDWAFSFGLDPFSPGGLLLERIVKSLKKPYTIDDMLEFLAMNEELQNKKTGFSKQTIRSISSRLEGAKAWGIFSKKATPIEEIAKEGTITIVDISFLEEKVAALVVGLIARKALARRKIESRREATEGRSSFPPVWLFIDEGHTLVPKDKKTAASEPLIEYVKQGRKPGCSLVIATQQPSAISSELLSQIDMMFVHQLVFEDDIKAVRKRIPANLPKEVDTAFIRSLKPGSCIIGDRETLKFVVAQIRPRYSQHEGRSTLAIKRPKVVVEKEKTVEEKKKYEKEETKKERESRKAGKTIAVIKERFTPEMAKEELKKTLRGFLFIKTEEPIIFTKVYWPFWLLKVLKDGEEKYILFDAVKGELPGTKGFQKVLGRHYLAFRILSKEGHYRKIAEELGLDDRIVKLYLNRLAKEGLVSFRKGYAKPRVKLKEAFLDDAPEIAEAVQEGVKLRINFTVDKNMEKTLGVKILEKELVYLPYFYMKTTKGREVLFNLVTGEIKETRLKLRI